MNSDKEKEDNTQAFFGKSMIPVPGQAGEDGVPVSDVAAVLQDGAVQGAVRSHHALQTVVLSHVRTECST